LAQEINPAQEFTLQFNGLTGATGNDFVALEITDQEFNTIISAPDLCVPFLLPNTATSFVIPADTLDEGKTYNLRLSYSRTFYNSTTSPAGFASFGALQRSTVLTIATTGGVVVPQPTIADIAFQGGFFAFTVGNLNPGTLYRVQYRDNVAGGTWSLVQTVNSSTPMPLFDLTSSSTTGERYYRVITP
jgi:hypothetical protein